jgi:3'-phosphoadenosine 5'-phosphosulfate sulfotransferase (PAPS reductase)/FAD synthetase
MARRELLIPAQIASIVMDPEALLLISVSGGKDSQAMLLAVTRAARAQGWLCRLEAVHADLGEAEWDETPETVKAQVAATGLPYHVVAREGGLMGRMEARMHQIKASGESKPFWPSSAARYCTSDLKREPINKLIRRLVPLRGTVVSVEGIRGQESTTRGKKPVVSPRTKIDGRLALTWNAIHDWKIQDVWAEIGTTVGDLLRRRGQYAYAQELRAEGRAAEAPFYEAKAVQGWPAHVAYVYGNERLSCVFCILGCVGDLKNGAAHRPALLEKYIAMERESGYTFRQGFSLESLRA